MYLNKSFIHVLDTCPLSSRNSVTVMDAAKKPSEAGWRFGKSCLLRFSENLLNFNPKGGGGVVYQIPIGKSRFDLKLFCAELLFDALSLSVEWLYR